MSYHFEPETRNKYSDLVNQAIAHRFRVVALFGSLLYLAFIFLDMVTYAEHGLEFFVIRLAVSASLLCCYTLSFFRRTLPYILWLTDFIIILAGLGIVLMIYRTDGIESLYYQGLNLVFLGMLTINSFRFGHHIFAGGWIITSYLLAVYLNSPVEHLASLASPLFFMNSTLAFVIIMTILFAKQHRNEFLKTEQLALSAKELEQVNAKLRATEQLKDQFIANISHELRTPLTLIKGPLEKQLTLRKKNKSNPLSEDLLQDLQTMERNAAVLLKLVNDLLDISKLEAGSMTLNYQLVDLDQMLKFTASHFENLAQDLEFRFELKSPGKVLAQCDPEKLERVLFNLLSNAFKFTPKGGAILYSLEVEGNEGIISVKDSGPGVEPALRSIIFDRFRQGEGGDTRRFGGTGLGLAISKEFIELHDGKIILDETWTSGAAFVIKFPLRNLKGRNMEISSDHSKKLAKQGVAEIHDENFGVVFPDRKQVAKQGERPQSLVLVVEDHPEMNQFIADILAEEFKVLSAFNGQEGAAIATNQKPDLIITDIMMPDMSGEQLVQVIRSRQDLSAVPVLVLTAKADDKLRSRLLQNGAQDYLYKPFSVDELLARVRNLITMKKIRDILSNEIECRNQDLVAMAETLAVSKKNTEEALLVAEEAARTKDIFLMNLSHELRTPLTAILGWTDLLSQGLTEAEESELTIQTISRNAHTLLRLVDDLLDLSRIIQGKLKLEVDGYDLRDIIAAAVQSVSIAAKAKSINIQTQFASQSRFCICDFDRMQQVIWNVLSNAVKFTPEKGDILVNLTEEQQVAVIQVIDNGKGIDPQFLPQVFDRLKQADSSTTKRFGGLGLGLAIARHLVDLHGGTITADSSGEGKGSTFTIRIPYDQKVVPFRPLSSAPTKEQNERLQGIHAIVVDDEPDTINLVSTILKKHGATVSSANTAIDAVKLFQQVRADILISDIGMADHDGIWLIHEIRGNQKLNSSSVPAIALTAYVEEKTREKSISAGYQSFLGKPVRANELVQAVVDLTSASSQTV